MGIFSAPKSPKLPPPPPPPPQLPQGDVQAAGADERRRAQMEAGVASTILTSPQGVLGNADTTKKALLGG